MAHCLKHKGNYSDEFWMLSFKVVPCTKTYAHSWSSCPCAHPGETARRRDPTLFNYQPVLCPNVKSKSGCPSGDSCGYAHNVFEQWLHPQRYKALMCTYGSQCTRPSCFFAHSLEELRVPWKGGTGDAPSGETQSQQSQPQPQQQQQQSQQQPQTQRGTGPSGPLGDGGEAARGTPGRLSAAGGASGSESDAAAAVAAVSLSSSISVSGHAVAAAAVAGVVGCGAGNSGRPRLVMQAPGGLQLQHVKPGGLLPGGGSGMHSVVDVRVVAAGSAGQSLSSDHALMLGAAHPYQPHQARRGPQGASIGSGTVIGQLQHRGSTHTSASASAPYDLDTATFIPLESTSLALVSGPPNQVSSSSQLHRTPSNGSTLYAGLTEEVAPAALPSAGHGGGAPGGTADVALVPSESTSATSLYHTPGSTSHHPLTGSGLSSVGIYVGGPAVQGGGGAGEMGAAAAAAGGIPGARPLPVGAPQLQQHLQQLHQHQHQMQLQQQQAQRTGGASGSGTGPNLPSAAAPLRSGPFIMKPLPGQGGAATSAGAGAAGWMSQAQQQSGGADFGQTGGGGGGGGGGTASMDFTGPQQSSTLAAHSSSNLLDLTEEVEPSGGVLSGWVTVALPPSAGTTADGRDGSSLDTGGYSHQAGQGHPQQQQQQQQQTKQLGLQLRGATAPFAAAGSSGQRAGGASRSISGMLPEEAAAAAAAVQQLQLSGPGQQQQQAAGGGQDAATAAAAAAGVLGTSSLGDGGLNSQGVFADASRPGFRRPVGLNLAGGPTSTSTDLYGTNAAATTSHAAAVVTANAAAAAAAAARIDPDVEMLLLSSLQLQLNHAGVASHPVVSSFPVRQWLRQAIQGRAQAATRAYLLDLLSQYIPPDQLGIIRRLLDCLDEAGTLLSCFAGPAVAASTHGSVTGGVVPNAALGGGPAGTGAGST